MSSAPGVSVQEMFSLSLSVRANATAVPLLVGRFPGKDGVTVKAEKGCVKINSWLDYETVFGTGSAVPVVTLKAASGDAGNDDEGGGDGQESKAKAKSRAKRKTNEATAAGDAYDIDVEFPDDDYPSVLSLRHYFDNGGGPCYVLSYDGAADDGLDTIAGEIAKNPDISLLVLAQPETDGNARTTIYGQFNLSVEHDKGRFVIASGADAESQDAPSVTQDQMGFYYPYLYVSYKHSYDAGAVKVSGRSGTTVETLADLEASNPKLYRDICEKIDTELRTASTLALPPGPAVAGAYCRTDLQRGVWKAPANIPLRGVAGLTVKVGDADHGKLNEKGINVIRQFNSRGAVIYGARTQVKTLDWMYIPVRRLFGAAERDIQKALRPVVFEPNNAPTWERARAAIDNYLHTLWEKGALLGKTPAEAYFVNVGKNITMTDADIKQGKMIIKVGMAAVRPAEFVILQFTQEVGVS